MDIAASQRRAYGTLVYQPPSGSAERRGTWVVDATPYLAVRLKRLIPRVQQSRTGAIHIAASPETARDVEWITQRYSLDMDEATRARLTEQADQHRDTEAAVMSILGGQRLNTGVREPARQPYPEQLTSADLAMRTGRLLITDEVGLGKSLTGLLVLRAADALPALVVTLTHLPKQWIGKELRQTFPDLRGHIIASTTVYDPGDVDVIAISYSKLAAWADYLAGKVQTVIFDEVQELRHDGTAKYTAAAQIADQATYKIGLSATPVYNYGGEAYNVLNLLAPDALGSRAEFLREWGQELTGGKIKVRDPKALGEHLRAEGLMIGHTREEVGRPLPQPTIVEQNVDADPQVYQQLAGDAVEMAKFILNRDNHPRQRWLTSGELNLRLRQATGVAKAPGVAEFCRMLLHDTPRLVLWGWHRSCYDLWLEQLEEFHPVLYTGSETVASKHRSVEAFLDGKSRILIMSLRSGAGLDGLQLGCDTAVFGELDWSPQVHRQCIGRLVRDGIDHAPTAYFCVSAHGSDPPMAQVLNIKQMQNDPMVNPHLESVRPAAANDNHIRALAESVIERAGRQSVAA